MKRCVFFTVMLAALVAVFSCGCDGDDDGDGQSVSQNLTGEWTLTFDSGLKIAMTFQQDDNGKVQGVGQDRTGDPWSFSGTLSGEKLAGTMLPAMTISALVDRNVLAGTYRKDATTSGSFTGERL